MDATERARLERIRSKVEHGWHLPPDDARVLLDTIERLERELQAARVDAARYRWLRSRSDAHIKAGEVCIFWPNANVGFTLQSADGVIDDALAGEDGR